MRFTSSAIVALILGTSLTAQLAISEVLFDPIGPDAGNEIIEVTNVSGAAFTPTGWFLCVPFTYGALPAISIPAGGVVQFHLGVSGTNTATDFFFPSFAFRALASSDTAMLYDSNLFSVDSDIMDFVSWGGGTLRANQAVNIGQWPAIGETVAGPFVEGESIAWSGSGDSAAAWHRDASPTLGTTNGADVVLPFGTACATSAGVPSLAIPSPAVAGNRDFVFRLTGGPATAPSAVFVGVPSGGIPAFGCSLEVLNFATILGVTDSSGAADLGLPLTGPGTMGLTLWFQVFSLDAAAPNALFGATDAVAITFG